MTRKHFAAIAADIKAQYEAETNLYAQDAVRSTAYKLARTFASFNPNFDRIRFIMACGV